MENIQIKVNTKLMNLRADEAASYVNELNKSLDEIQKRISNLETIWEGNAASEYFEIYKSQSGEIKKIVEEILNHIGEVKNAAQIYESAAEKVNSGHQRNLPKSFLD